MNRLYTWTAPRCAVCLLPAAIFCLAGACAQSSQNVQQSVDDKWGVRDFYPVEACNDLAGMTRGTDEYWAVRDFCDDRERIK